jgi:hypothetical protein
MTYSATRLNVYKFDMHIFVRCSENKIYKKCILKLSGHYVCAGWDA